MRRLSWFFFTWVPFSSLAILFVSLPESSWADDAHFDWRSYGVSFPEGRESDSMELSPWIENTQSFVVRGIVSDSWLRIEKIDTLFNGAEMRWEFILATPGYWLRGLEKSLLDPTGKNVATTKYDFTNPILRFPPQVAHLFTIPFILLEEDLPLEKTLPLEILITEDATPWKVYLTVTEEVKVSAPGGDFECVHIELEPDYDSIMGSWSWASFIIDPFVPDFDFWLTKDKPHHLIRFKGRFGPVGASSLQQYDYLGSVSAIDAESNP